MAAIAQSLPDSNGRLPWLWEFLKHELAPYPGRVALVARMVTASTLVMILSMTFQIPYGAYGAIYAVTLSRESLEGTASSVRQVAIGFVLAGAYALVGAMLVLGSPPLRVLWVVGTLFLIFYAISAMSSYAAAARFGYMLIITIPLWDRQIPADQKVRGTLWAVGAITMASVITLLLETVFAAFRRSDDLTEGITNRLGGVEELLARFAAGAVDGAAEQSAVTRLAMVGTSRLRQILQRSNSSPQYAQQMGAVVALVGRLVDIAANLKFTESVTDDDRKRVGKVAQNIAGLRNDLAKRIAPRPVESLGEGPPPGIPLLLELERTVSLIPEVFTGSQSLSLYTPMPIPGGGRTLPLSFGALTKAEHIKFGLRGCLAASLCYLTYNFLFWPGLSTSVTTCLLTALSTVGASHQKQVLRITGALVGGVGFGIGAQVFILPYIDSIGGFTVLFATVACAAAWFATSSSRLSYFGVQILVAFCLINLPEFTIQTSLAVARDRVVGILLGLFAMWLAFDRLWTVPSGIGMETAFISNLRLLAQFVREPVSSDLRIAIERSYALRESINASFDKVRSLADSVLFEFGSARRRNIAIRDRIKRWQPQLRALFVTQVALLKYRLQLPGFELPDPVRAAQKEFDDRVGAALDQMANRIESDTPGVTENSRGLFERLQQAVRTHSPAEPGNETLNTFLALARNMENVIVSLDEDINRIPG